MKVLREKLPSGSALKALQSYKDYGDKLGMHAPLYMGCRLFQN